MLPALVLAALSGHAAAAVFVGGFVLFVIGRALEEVPSERIDHIDAATPRVGGRTGVCQGNNWGPAPPLPDHTNSTGPR